MNTLFLEVGAVILVAGGLSLIAQRFRQPLIIAYILTGVLVGPSVFGFVEDEGAFQTMSEIGIAILLFTVGLNLNWRSIKDVGRVALATGIAQALFTSLIGFGIGRLLGFDYVTAAFLSVAFAFSSTIVVVKLLADKDDLDRLYARIAVGMLIVQDLIAMFALLILAAFRDGGSIGEVVTVSLVKGIVVLAALWVVSHVLLPRVFRFAARSQELLFLSAIAWCFALAGALYLVGFGIEIGALLAGISLAGSQWQREIEARVRPLRDFFLIIFFIVLGTHLGIGNLGAVVWPAVIFGMFVLFGNPLIVLLIMRFMGYHPRVGFLTGTTVAQISEFSFILLSGAVAAGLISGDVMPLATMVGLVTIALSSYLISYNSAIYERFRFIFDWMATGRPTREARRKEKAECMLFGYQRMGRGILPKLQEVSERVLVVDCNPEVIEQLAHEGVASCYGDAGSEDLLQFVSADKAKLLISTIPDVHVSRDILEYVRARKSKAIVVVTVRKAEEAERCYALGASYVIIPTMLGGEAFGQYLQKQKLRRGGWQSLAKRHMRQVVK